MQQRRRNPNGIWEEGLSSLFMLGREGLSVSILLQFLAIAFFVTLFRFLFFTDTIIKTMPIVSSMAVMIVKEKSENKKMEETLKKLKMGGGEQ